MAQKAIREYDAKSILAKHWDKYFPDLLMHTKQLWFKMDQNFLKLQKIKSG